jgi:hypothetical protein
MASIANWGPIFSASCPGSPYVSADVEVSVGTNGEVAWASHFHQSGSPQIKVLRAGIVADPGGALTDLSLPYSPPPGTDSGPNGLPGSFAIEFSTPTDIFVVINRDRMHRVYDLGDATDIGGVSFIDLTSWGTWGYVYAPSYNPQVVRGLHDGKLHFVVPIQTSHYGSVTLHYVRLDSDLEVEVSVPLSSTCHHNATQGWRVSRVQDDMVWVLALVLCEGSNSEEWSLIPFHVP